MSSRTFLAALPVAAWVMVAPEVSAETRPPCPENEDGIVLFQQVVEVPERSAKELQANARLWIAEAFKSAPDVTMLDQEGTIIAKGWTLAKGGMAPPSAHFTLRIDTKDGRARVTLSDIGIGNTYGERFKSVESYVRKSDGTKRKPNGLYDKMARRVCEAVEQLLEEASTALQEAASTPDEDW